MGYWLIIIDDATDKIIDTKSFASYKAAKKASIGIEDDYGRPVRVQIQILPVGQRPKD